MVNPIKKLFIVFICLALVACARSPKVIDAESLSISIAEEIAELEIDASLKNIDLHTAIAIYIGASLPQAMGPAPPRARGLLPKKEPLCQGRHGIPQRGYFLIKNSNLIINFQH